MSTPRVRQSSRMTYRDDVRKDPSLYVLLGLRIELFLRDYDSLVIWRRILVSAYPKRVYAMPQ